MSLAGTKDFPRCIQYDDYSCGARCVYAIAKQFVPQHRNTRYRRIYQLCEIDKEQGTSTGPLMKAVRSLGLRAPNRTAMRARDLTKALRKQAAVIAWCDGDHLLVVHGIDDKWVYLSDPSPVRTPGRKQRRATFFNRWMRWGIAVYPD